MCKNRTQDFGVLISQQFILHGTFGKKVQVRSISRSCLLLLNQNYLIVSIDRNFWVNLSIYIYVHTFVIFLAFFLPPRRERLHYIIYFFKGPPQLFSLPWSAFFSVPNPGCSRTRMPINFFNSFF